MSWLAGAALVLDCVLVLVLALIGIVTGQDAAFIWLTIGMTAVLAVTIVFFMPLLGTRGAEEEPLEAPGGAAETSDGLEQLQRASHAWRPARRHVAYPDNRT